MAIKLLSIQLCGGGSGHLRSRTMTEEGVGSGRREIDQGSSGPGTASIPQIVV